MRPHGRYVSIDPNNPEHTALCQRCGSPNNRVNLMPQMQWAGMGLIDTGYRVCARCLDVPNPNERTLILPPDPAPIFDALPIAFPMEEDDYLTDEAKIPLDDEAGTPLIQEGDD
jgi:hypothetical protein